MENVCAILQSSAISVAHPQNTSGPAGVPHYPANKMGTDLHNLFRPYRPRNIFLLFFALFRTYGAKIDFCFSMLQTCRSYGAVMIFFSFLLGYWLFLIE